MATDHLSHLLLVMTVVGMWPLDWRNQILKSLYLVYSRCLDTLLICYLIAKLLLTYQVRSCDKFMQQIFESAFLFVLTLQSLAIFRSKEKIKELVRFLNEELKSSPLYDSLTAKRYSTYEKWITLLFGSATIFGVIEVFVYNNNLSSKCEAQYEDKFDVNRKLLIEVWLPYDETRSPFYEITYVLNVLLCLVTSIKIYILGVIIPLFVLEACCHFRIAADIFRNNIRINEMEYGMGKVPLVSAIKYHQLVLEFSIKLNNCFNWIVGLKILFLSLPIIVGIFALTKQVGDVYKEGMVHFMVQLLIELFVFCWFGEQLSHHSHLVREAMYESKWYEMGNRDQKRVLQVLLRCQRVAQLEVAARFRPANLETFIAVSHFSYSLYTMLTSLATFWRKN